MTRGSPEDGYQSILTTTETDTMKKVLYHCRARFIPERSIQGYNETTLEVQGMNHYEFLDKRCISGSSIEMYSLVLIFYYNNNIHTTQTCNPIPPYNVMVTEVCNDRATIQWTVHSIAYTPETYVVEYGTSWDSLDLTSDSQHSGPDITVTDVTYSVQLSNLEPAIYHYQVVATNTADRSTASGVHAFLASDSCKLCNNSISSVHHIE